MQNTSQAEMGSLEGDHEAKAAHVLAIPFPTHGHIDPLLRLTIQLARKGITVSFVCFEDSVPSLPANSSVADDDTSSVLHASLDSFRFVTLHRPPPDPQDSPFAPIKILREAFQPFLEKLVHDKSAGIPAGPTCIISDAFLPWTLDVAKELRIPRYTLVASGAIFVRLMQGSLEYFESGQFQVSETDGKLIEFDWPVFISGLPPLRYHDLNVFLRSRPAAFRETAQSVMKSAGVLVNSFLELEQKVVEECRSLRHSTENHIQVPKIYLVGPLFSTNVLPNSTTLTNGPENSSRKCLLWLGSQSPSSVLYVAFGSQARLHSDEINEMAHGLEASNQRFLWVIPQSKDSSKQEIPSIAKILPQGFETRVRDRGFIVTGWAPQLQILAHSSTGGFMTHSGWNSSLESIIFGVPMISWPQGAEQHFNCRYFVDELEVAEQLQTGQENILKRSEVERAVRLLMVEPEGIAMRNKVQELQTKAAIARSKGGSKLRNFQELFDEMYLNIM